MHHLPAIGSLGGLLAVLFGLGLFTSPPAPKPAPPPERKVKLAVLIVFDQLRADLIERWRPLFGPDGFVRLQNEGAWFTHCHYPYGVTTTGPGHASMLTGAAPDVHGIVNNNWLEGGKDTYCAGSPRHQLVPPVPTFPGDDKPKEPAKGAKPKEKLAGTPELLRSETVADVLKERFGDKSKVFGLSLKDRSAILPTGKRPDGAYWFYGTFGTSTYYRDAVHPWVAEFNKGKFADRWFQKDWTKLRPDLDYAAWTGYGDDVRGEGRGPGAKTHQGIAFPHPTDGGKKELNSEYYEAVANSPFGNDLLLDFTKACVTAENLGADDVPDLLVVSFSSNDLVGHTWGPDSHEVLDTTLRSDALMAELLKFLDAKVGKGQYVLGLTADHGICPLPELSKVNGTARCAARVNVAEVSDLVNAHLTNRFPRKAAAADSSGKAVADKWVEAVSLPWVQLNSRLVKESGRPMAEVAAAAAEAAAKHPNVFRTLTRAQLEGEFPPGDLIGQRMKRSYYGPRCGDLALVLNPYSLPGGRGDGSTGTTHGAPFNYDTHVPLLVYGPGIRGGVRAEPTTPQALASIFAKWLSVRRPKDAAFPVPDTLE